MKLQVITDSVTQQTKKLFELLEIRIFIDNKYLIHYISVYNKAQVESVQLGKT